MQVLEKRLKDNVHELTVQLEAELLEKHLARAVRHYSNRLKVPGFRKGRIPREIVELNVGMETLLEYAVDDLAPAMIESVIKQEDLAVVGVPRLEMEQMEQPIKLKLKLAAKPAAQLAPYSELVLSDEGTEDDVEERVESVLKDIQRTHSPWEFVDDPVQNGDRVMLTATGKSEGTEDADVLDWRKQDYFVDAASDYPIDGFAQQLEGMRKGQRREFKLTVPESYHKKELVGRTVEFNVLLQRNSRQELKPLSDEMVASMKQEDISTVDELRRRITENVTEHNNNMRKSRYREQVIAQLADKSEFSIADILVEDEANRTLRQQRKQLKGAKITLEEHLSKVGKTQEQHMEELKEASLKRLKRTVLLDALVEQERPELEEGALDDEIRKIKSDRQYAGRVKDWDGLRERVEESMLEQAALDAVIKTLDPGVPEIAEED